MRVSSPTDSLPPYILDPKSFLNHQWWPVCRWTDIDPTVHSDKTLILDSNGFEPFLFSFTILWLVGCLLLSTSKCSVIISILVLHLSWAKRSSSFSHVFKVVAILIKPRDSHAWISFSYSTPWYFIFMILSSYFPEKGVTHRSTTIRHPKSRDDYTPGKFWNNFPWHVLLSPGVKAKMSKMDWKFLSK